MKKFILLEMLISLLSFNLIGQQLENPGFENWEDAGTVIDEPTDWSSIKTSDGGDLINNAAPVVWEQSTDAHSGQYSIKLVNIAAFNIVATGTITNGRVHADFNPDLGYIYTDPNDAQWSTPFTGRPDSLVIWMKYYPQANDSAQVQVLLHTGEGSLPPTPENTPNWVGIAKISVGGTYDSWTRFSVPFTYFSTLDPAYALVVINSGNGTMAIENSYALFDDIQLIYGPQSIDKKPDNKPNIYYSNGQLFFGKYFNKQGKNTTAHIYDLTGKEILSVPIESASIEIPLNKIDRGIYFVQVRSNTRIYTKKIYID